MTFWKKRPFVAPSTTDKISHPRAAYLRPLSRGFILIKSLGKKRAIWMAFYLAVNLAGMQRFIRCVVDIEWLARMEERTYYDLTDGTKFLLVTAAGALIGLISSAVWLVRSVTKAFRVRDYRPAMALILVVASWVALGVAFKMDVFRQIMSDETMTALRSPAVPILVALVVTAVIHGAARFLPCFKKTVPSPRSSPQKRAR